MATKVEKKEAVTQKAIAFTKEQLLKSKRYGAKQDVLSAVLNENRSYTHDEVDVLYNQFMNKKEV